MKLLITGSGGQLGRELVEQSRSRGFTTLAPTRNELDITEEKTCEQYLLAQSPDVLINAAAWTAVDRAESNPATVLQVNQDAVQTLARLCQKFGIRLVQYSTDYVFNGLNEAPYKEDDLPDPVNVYGKSKLGAEIAVREYCDNYLIIRTSAVFSLYGQNFVKAILRNALMQKSLKVVADQVSKPTSTMELADRSLELLEFFPQYKGIVHIAQGPPVSWYAFAKVILETAKQHGIPIVASDIEGIVSSEYPSSATRPHNAVLDCSKIEKILGVGITPWQGALSKVISELKHDDLHA